jgi:Sap, sulfolipid-1-addressing protein
VGGAIGEMLPLAIGIAISPLAIVAVILILTTPRARTNGPAFLGGWLLGLAVVGGVTLVATDAAESAGTSGPRSIVAALKIVLGVALLVLAWRRFRSRPKPGEEAPLPKWMAALDRFTPGRSLAVGALFGGIKPKNLILAAAAAAGIAGSDLGGAQQVVVLLLLILVASVAIIAPVAIYFFMGEEKAARVLDGWKTWLQANNSTVMIVLFVVFGVVLLGKGIGGL